MYANIDLTADTLEVKEFDGHSYLRFCNLNSYREQIDKQPSAIQYLLLIIIIKQLHHLYQYWQMKAKKLSDKITTIKAASDFEHKLIDSIYSIMSLKRKAQFDYRTSLQGINRELERYIISDNGFLTEMVKAFQSYITILYQNQSTLIEGYDNEILSFLVKAKQSNLEQDILKKVQFVDSKVEGCKEQIKHYKRLIKQNQEDLQIISSEVTFKGKINQLTQEEKKKMAQKFSDIQNLKKINEENLQHHVDGMMDLTMLHNQTIEQLNQYQTIYLEQKASDVYDNFMRTFVLEVSFIRSMQFDITSILQKVNDRKDQNKKIAFDNLRKKMNQQKGIKDSFWSTYKKWANPQIGVDINESYINPKIREKWRRVCEYYNQTSM